MPFIHQPHSVPRGTITANGLCIRNAQGRPTIACARQMSRAFGTFKAARYLRSRGWSLEAALHILTSPQR